MIRGRSGVPHRSRLRARTKPVPDPSRDLARRPLPALFFNALTKVRRTSFPKGFEDTLEGVPAGSVIHRMRPRRPPGFHRLRRLLILGLGSALVGAELATGAFSTLVIRLFAGLAAMGSGGDPPVPIPRFVSGLVLLAGGVGVLLFLTWVARHERAIETGGGACPQCGTDTKRIRKTEAQRLLVKTTGRRLTHRRCARCGWTGMMSR